jgi:diketogulonate reductase-like aldo/keto reductase
MCDLNKPELKAFGTYRIKGQCAYDTVKHAFSLGYNLVDTAPLYGNEEEVGKAIKDSGKDMKEIKITTKISRDDLSKGTIKESFFRSLKALNVNYIDELILHEPIDHLKNWQSLCELYNNEGRGLIGRIGVSNYNKTHLEDIINSYEKDKSKLHIPSVNQIEVTPFLMRGDLPDFCKKNNIFVVAHSPLTKGEKLNDSNLVEIAKNCNTTPAKILLTWGIQKGYRVIPRSSNTKHLEENLSNNEIKINNSDIELLDKLDCCYATHPKYLTEDEMKQFELNKKSTNKINTKSNNKQNKKQNRENGQKNKNK